jgi:hypothetical protein
VTRMGANPFAFAFMALLLVGVGLYYAWGAVDRIGLTTQAVRAQVTGKQLNPSRETYRTTVAAGRAFTQSDRPPDAYVLILRIGNEVAGLAVDPAQYEAVRVGQSVDAVIHRTRLGRRLEIIELRAPQP